MSPTDTASPEQSTTPADDYDPVVDEAKRWENLSQEHYQAFIGEDGLLNKFAMMWALRERFLLHLIIFKQTACDLLHEANVENLFSRAQRPQHGPTLLGHAHLDHRRQGGVQTAVREDQGQVL
jgi:hypothetical protein